MALPLGKLGLVIGAGLAGSMLANEGGLSKLSDILSGSFKVIGKHLKEDKSSKEKTTAASLMEQVNNVREELNMLINQSRLTIVSGGSQSGGSYAVPVIVIGVAGYGFIWWKGWKLSDLMIVTRKSLSDACVTLGKQFEQVSSSLASAKRHLSSKIDNVDKNLDEYGEINASTKNEVENLRGDFLRIGSDVQSVQLAVQGLDYKIGLIEGKQDYTNLGLYNLCRVVKNIENNSKAAEPKKIFTASKQAIDYKPTPSQISSFDEASSSSQNAREPLSPEGRVQDSSRKVAAIGIVSPKVSGIPPASGLKAFSEPVPGSAPKILEANKLEDKAGNSANSNKSDWKFPGLGMSFFQRPSFTKSLSSKS